MKLLRQRRSTQRFMHRATPFMNAAGSASRLLGHDYIATEHLLLALSQDRGSATARMLARDGLSTDEIRSEISTLIGVCDSPRGQIDGDALATLGIDIDQVRRQAERAFGQDALERTWTGCTPVAPRLKRALELAVREAGDTPLPQSTCYSDSRPSKTPWRPGSSRLVASPPLSCAQPSGANAQPSKRTEDWGARRAPMDPRFQAENGRRDEYRTRRALIASLSPAQWAACVSPIAGRRGRVG